jgi:hypothetical protein
MENKLMATFNRLVKWRSVLAGWQLGTRRKGDAESDAVRDHREATLILRVETTAVMRLLIEKEIFTMQEWEEICIEEAEEVEKMLEKRFPGFKATDAGISMDLAVIRQHGTMDGWRSWS